MSKIDTLIAELCPDGVEYRKLGEIANIRKGEQLNKNSLLADGPYPVLNGGRDYSGYWTEFNSKSGVVTVSQGGASAGFVSWMTVPFWAGAHCYVVEKSASCEARYLFHVMKSCEAGFMQSQYGAGIPSLSAKTLAGTEIPVPPIEVQREIVRILDAFAALTDELTAKLAEEVTARRQQYAHYRDRLLSRESLEALDGKPVEMVRLGDVGAFYGGLTGKSKEDFKEGSSLFVPYTNVYNNAAVDFENLDTVNVADGERQHEIAYGDVLITGSSETPDDCGMTSVVMQSPEVQTYLNSFCFGWRPNSLEAFEPGYLKYAFRAYGARRQIVKTANGVTRFNISKEAFGRVEIPVPSLATQQRIVDILDRLDALTTSLTDGLPAEIEARKAQYTYYRDCLLDFPRKAIETE